MGRLEAVRQGVGEHLAVGKQRAHTFARKIRDSKGTVIASSVAAGAILLGTAWIWAISEREMAYKDNVVHEEVPGAGSYDVILNGEVIKVTLIDEGTGAAPDFTPLSDASLKRISEECSPLDYVAFANRRTGSNKQIVYLGTRGISARDCFTRLSNNPIATPTPTS